MKILLLILLSSILLSCRTKHKITTTHKENTKESERIKVDSSSLQSLQSIQSQSDDVLQKEEKNEISGDLLIRGKSDGDNPFVYHNVVGNDTLQSISIMGNAEYTISNHYTKANNQKTEVKKEVSAKIVQDVTQKTASKESLKEIASKVSEETQKIKLNGFDAAAWIFITIVGITLILIFFTYKYLKK
ncbi:hypothetical protein F3J23_14420 [Chryseobacterium sp. Tr-659]|uniref:hypothetical protein n=1 Tax=Chryseobacterium sp. Tr-659 TaxID=2608340 RepID=UPI00141EDAD6|nr:hypothetical protein [Chryseobacterium sp. Tr-659]NIF06641.1 hypothetical protein [Chryseobacterium sp. Tr-659]